jgi:tetratricopeptide (TPR) repeat protein
MLRRPVLGTLVLSVLLWAAAPAVAADFDDCMKAPPAKAFGACERLIASGKLKGGSLAAAYNNRGNFLIERKEFQRAVEDFNRALKLLPTEGTIYAGRGTAYYHLRQYDLAISDFDTSLRLKPNLFVALSNRGSAYSEKRDLDRALADYSAALRLNPKSGVTLIGRGSVLITKGEYDRAIADAKEALRLNARDGHAYAMRGDARRGKGEIEGAIEDYTEAVRLDPTLIRAFVGRGLVYEKMGDRRRASADLSAALALPAATPFAESFQTTARERLAAIGDIVPAANAGTPPSAQPVAPAPTLLATPARQSNGGRRVALVIGNSAYRTVAALPNPRRDAEAVAAGLRGSGFQSVTLETDLTRDTLVDALRRFAAESEKADWALIYFAGHGIELGGTNYLIPVEAKLAADRDVQFEAVPLEQVMAAVDGARKLRLVMLDACRDNPFVNQMRRSVASRSIGRGLGQIEPEAGTLVVYAAKHGQVALDGEGTNSPFVAALLERMRTPGLEVRRLVDLVRDDVLAATSRRQQPFSYGSLPGSEDYFFRAQ